MSAIHSDAGARPAKPFEARRAHTAVTHPEWTKKHSHNDAARVMTKRVLRDLWRAWRQSAGLADA